MKDQLDALIPIFYKDKNGENFEHIGTGIFLFFRGFYFILTAAHVTDELEDGDLLVPTEDDTIQYIDGAYSYYSPGGNRNDDLIDVGYYKLDSKFAESLLSQFTPILETEIHFSKEFPEMSLFSISGYPHRKSKIRNGIAKTEVFSFGAYQASISDYKRLNCFQKPNIVAKFNRKKTIDPETKVKNISVLPHGVSGGGFFIWPQKITELPPKNRKLVGIAHTFKEKEGLFIGTNIIFVLQSILRNNPELNVAQQVD